MHLGYPAKGLLTDTMAKAHTVRDLKATDHQTWPPLQSWSGLENESSTHFGKTQVSAVPHRQQHHQRRTELAGGTFEQPTQEAAVILTVNFGAPDQTASATNLLGSFLRFAEQSTPQFRRRYGTSTGKAMYLRPSQQLHDPFKLGILPIYLPLDIIKKRCTNSTKEKVVLPRCYSEKLQLCQCFQRTLNLICV